MIDNYHDIDSIKKHVSNLTEQNNILIDLELDHKTQTSIINDKQKKIDHLTTHQYDSKCKYCVSNVFVQDAIHAKNQIDQDRKVLNELNIKIDNTKNKIKELSPFNIQLNDY